MTRRHRRRHVATSPNGPSPRALLEEAGYDGRSSSSSPTPTARSTTARRRHRRAAQAVGINARVNLVDWPTAPQIRLEDTGWQGGGGGGGGGGLDAGWMGNRSPTSGRRPRLDARRNAAALREERPRARRPLPGARRRNDRGGARGDLAKIQERLYEFLGIIKIADVGMMMATSADVENFEPFRFPRMYDVWFAAVMNPCGSSATPAACRGARTDHAAARPPGSSTRRRPDPPTWCASRRRLLSAIPVLTWSPSSRSHIHVDCVPGELARASRAGGRAGGDRAALPRAARPRQADLERAVEW